MKRKTVRRAARWVCFALTALLVVPGHSQTQPASGSEVNNSAPIPLDQLGAVAGKQYQGDGLSVSAMPEGARLRCAFQRLEGHVTSEGLWLSSTADNVSGERFRVMAIEVGRTEGFGLRRQSAAPTPLFDGDWIAEAAENSESGVALCFPPQSKALPVQGVVAINAQTVQFIRPGLTEEYSVSVDGVRQDFIIEQPPAGDGELRVELDVTGATVEPLVNGARLTLVGSGRKLAYNRLRVTDATGRELPARMEVASGILPDVAGAHAAARISPAIFPTHRFNEAQESAGLEAPALRQAKMPAATTLAVLVDAS